MWSFWIVRHVETWASLIRRPHWTRADVLFDGWDYAVGPFASLDEVGAFISKHNARGQ